MLEILVSAKGFGKKLLERVSEPLMREMRKI